MTTQLLSLAVSTSMALLRKLNFMSVTRENWVPFLMKGVVWFWQNYEMSSMDQSDRPYWVRDREPFNIRFPLWLHTASDSNCNWYLKQTHVKKQVGRDKCSRWGWSTKNGSAKAWAQEKKQHRVSLWLRNSALCADKSSTIIPSIYVVRRSPNSMPQPGKPGHWSLEGYGALKATALMQLCHFFFFFLPHQGLHQQFGEPKRLQNPLQASLCFRTAASHNHNPHKIKRGILKQVTPCTHYLALDSTNLFVKATLVCL